MADAFLFDYASAMGGSFLIPLEKRTSLSQSGEFVVPNSPDNSPSPSGDLTARNIKEKTRKKRVFTWLWRDPLNGSPLPIAAYRGRKLHTRLHRIRTMS